MSKIQMLEILNKIINQLHNAMDELDDVVDNDVPKNRTFRYMIEAEMSLNHLIDDVETEAVLDGTKSGAV